jgi:hypothetical protein
MRSGKPWRYLQIGLKRVTEFDELVRQASFPEIDAILAQASKNGRLTLLLATGDAQGLLWYCINVLEHDGAYWASLGSEEMQFPLANIWIGAPEVALDQAAEIAGLVFDVGREPPINELLTAHCLTFSEPREIREQQIAAIQAKRRLRAKA